MAPLKGIPSIIPSSLLKVLADMGHGDFIVIGDGNFPSVSTSNANNKLYIDMSTQKSIPELLEAIMKLFPLDTYDAAPVGVMDLVAFDKANGMKVSCWDSYRAIVENSENRVIEFEYIERFEFYSRAKNAFAVIATGDCAPYANIILRKGVLPFQM